MKTNGRENMPFAKYNAGCGMMEKERAWLDEHVNSKSKWRCSSRIDFGRFK